MFCEYCDVGDFSGICMCNKTHQICPFVRRCTNEHCWKPLQSMEKCKERKGEVIVPKGFNKVRFELHGYLYVEVGDFVYTIKNPYDYTPEFVKIKQVDNVWYIDGFEPTVEVKSDEQVESDNDTKSLNKNKKSFNKKDK